jgi:hypothetical protein
MILLRRRESPAFLFYDTPIGYVKRSFSIWDKCCVDGHIVGDEHEAWAFVFGQSNAVANMTCVGREDDEGFKSFAINKPTRNRFGGENA